MKDTKTPVSLTLVFFLSVMAYFSGYWGGSHIATNKCEKAIEQVGSGYAKKIADCSENLETSQRQNADYSEMLDFQLFPIIEDSQRLSSDLFFDLLQCRGGDDRMNTACEMDSNCSNCLAQRNEEGYVNPASYDYCVKHALHDKNEWYDVMGLPYYDGCAWDNCMCAEDEFIASNPDACSPELLEYYNK
jgi:hypothetical protein